MNADSSSKSIIEALKKVIEQIKDEHAIVELARIYAVKDYEATQSQREEDAAKHSETMKRIQRKKALMEEDIEEEKELEMKLAITESNIKKLEIQLKKEEAKKELGLVRGESFRYMDSMDDVRKELSHVAGEASRLEQKENKLKSRKHNLDSKLLRSKAKLQERHEALNKVRFTASSLKYNLEQLLSEAETAKEEISALREDIRVIECETEVRKNQIRRAKERLREARRELKGVKSSEAKALGNLRAITEDTSRSRTLFSDNKSSLTISKLEYEYLKNHAEDAKDIADKKVDAACAWAITLRESQRENEIKIQLLKVKKENDEPKDWTNVVSKQQEMGIENTEQEKAISNINISSISAKKTTKPVRQTRARRSASSPALARGGTPIRAATPIMVRRRRKGVTRLAKFFGGVRKDVV